MSKKIFPVMFHHFHDGVKHIKTQGSFDKDKLYNLIKKIGIKNILSPNEFLYKVKNKKLNSKETCITFDDGIKSQYDVAFPLLTDLNLTAFFFVYTSIFEKKINFLELNRYFREMYFKNVEDYYNEFYSILKNKVDWKKISFEIKKNKKYLLKQKKIYSFYSISDLKFRFIRDQLLNRENFNKISLNLFKKKNFNYKKANKELYINKNDLKTLSKYKTLIGLHSLSHPTNFDVLPYSEQLKELKNNKLKIEKIIKQKVFSLAYPLGKYNFNTLKVIKKLGIEIAFLSNPIKKNNNPFLVPREDHTILFKKL